MIHRLQFGVVLPMIHNDESIEEQVNAQLKKHDIDIETIISVDEKSIYSHPSLQTIIIWYRD
jgi:hypothetical protein